MTAPTLAWLRRAMLRDLEGLRAQLEAYRDEADIWRKAPGMANSTGTLALHLAGNLQHFIGAQLGGTGYLRDRDAEFARRGVPRAELLAELAAASRTVRETLESLSEADLEADYPDPLGGAHLSAGQFLVHLATHLAYHLGQVDSHRRAVTGAPSLPGTLSMAALVERLPETR